MVGLETFMFIAQNAPEHLFRYAMDWDKQCLINGAKEWEKREPHSLENVLNAYAFAVTKIRAHEKITVEDIKKIHKLCFDGKLGDQKELKCNIGGIFRGSNLEAWRWYFDDLQQIAQPIAVKITKETASIEGLKALIQAHAEYPYNLLTQIDTNLTDEQNLHNLINLLDKKKLYFYVYYGNISKAEFRDLAELSAKASIPNLKTDLSGFKYFQINYQQNLTQAMTKALATMHKELAVAIKADNQRDKLAAIVKCIQRLELIHPFYDGNCRTFCMVLLNILLMQYGFNPTLLDNPNKFDAHSVDELIELVRKGMERTIQLCFYIDNKQSNLPAIEKLRIDLKAWVAQQFPDYPEFIDDIHNCGEEKLREHEQAMLVMTNCKIWYKPSVKQDLNANKPAFFKGAAEVDLEDELKKFAEKLTSVLLNDSSAFNSCIIF